MASAKDHVMFDIFPTCIQCGHKGQLFINDRIIAQSMKAHWDKRAFGIWQALLVRRMFLSWGVMFALGALVGFLLGVR